MPEPPNAAEGSAEDGAGEVSGCEHCAHCKDHHRRVSTGSYVAGGYGAGGEANAHGGSGGEGGKGGNAVIQQIVYQYPNQERIDCLLAENHVLSHTIDELKQEAQVVQQLQEKEKANLAELALKLKEQETARKNERRKWKEAKEQFNKTHHAALETRSKQIEEDKEYAASVQAATDAQEEELKEITAALDAERLTIRMLDAEKVLLEKKVKALRDHLDTVGQLDSYVEQRPEGQLEQDIKEWEEKVVKANDNLTECNDQVTVETGIKQSRERQGKKYGGSLDIYEQELVEAREHLQMCVGKVEELKAKLRPQLRCNDSGYGSYSGQAKTEDTDVAATVWSCDECGKSVALELAHERGVVKSVRSTSIVYGKSGAPGEDVT